jgi:hypothetical protein
VDPVATPSPVVVRGSARTGFEEERVKEMSTSLWATDQETGARVQAVGDLAEDGTAVDWFGHENTPVVFSVAKVSAQATFESR